MQITFFIFVLCIFDGICYTVLCTSSKGTKEDTKGGYSTMNNKNKKIVRIVALGLAVLMVLSVFGVILSTLNF